MNNFFKVPFSGVVNVTAVCGPMTNPDKVGLVMTSLPPLEGEYVRYRVTGVIPEDIHDEHDEHCMVNPRPFYAAGHYDFQTVQGKPENWAGYFDG